MFTPRHALKRSIVRSFCFSLDLGIWAAIMADHSDNSTNDNEEFSKGFVARDFSEGPRNDTTEDFGAFADNDARAFGSHGTPQAGQEQGSQSSQEQHPQSGQEQAAYHSTPSTRSNRVQRNRGPRSRRIPIQNRAILGRDSRRGTRRMGSSQDLLRIRITAGSSRHRLRARRRQPMASSPASWTSASINSSP